MKKIEPIFVALLLVLMLGCNIGDSDSQSITIKKTETKYQLKASFPVRKTSKVFNYIKGALNEDKLFRDPEALKDADINLGDTLKFHLRSAPGLVEITFRKTDNSFKSYQQMEGMCAGIRRVLR